MKKSVKISEYHFHQGRNCDISCRTFNMLKQNARQASGDSLGKEQKVYWSSGQLRMAREKSQNF